MSRFNGKVAVVTGGNSGMGLATAKGLAANGAKVVIAGRDKKTLDEAVKAIGNESFGVKTDVSNLDDIRNLFDEVNAKFGKIDILFVNAGIGKFAPLEQSDEAFFDEVVDINFKGSFFTVKYASPFLNDGASIIFTTSANAQLGLPGTSVYGASKAALQALTRNFAAELIGRKIRVNAISPGPIDTPIFDKSDLTEEAKKGLKESVIAQVPMKRMGTMEEIAKTVAFLASDDSTFITGAEIPVDGGWTQF